MRSFLFVPLVAVLVPSIQVLKTSASFPSGSVEARGVCDVRPDAITCWDMDGGTSPVLSDSARSFFASNSQDVQFRLGRKNRYLVLRRPQSLQLSYRLGANDQVWSSSTYNVEPVTDFVRIAANPSDVSATLLAQTTIQSKQDTPLPFREGATVEFEGRKLEIGATTKVVAQKGKPVVDVYNRPRSDNVWSVVLGLSGESSSLSWFYTPLDANGVPILYVDADGKAITALKALALEPTLQPNGSSYYENRYSPQPVVKTKAAAAFFQGSGTPPAFRVQTNIDPKSIASLVIRTNRMESKEIGPFPLDPK